VGMDLLNKDQFIELKKYIFCSNFLLPSLPPFPKTTLELAQLLQHLL
jgi:hypothetical protein